LAYLAYYPGNFARNELKAANIPGAGRTRKEQNYRECLNIFDKLPSCLLNIQVTITAFGVIAGNLIMFTIHSTFIKQLPCFGESTRVVQVNRLYKNVQVFQFSLFNLRRIGLKDLVYGDCFGFSLGLKLINAAQGKIIRTL
jgi:hypothetical protein